MNFPKPKTRFVQRFCFRVSENVVFHFISQLHLIASSHLIIPHFLEINKIISLSQVAATSFTAMDDTQVTTFVVPNLHCNSCIFHIERALYLLQPRPNSVSHSIIAHTISVSHSHKLSPDDIAKVLDEAGFEVHDQKRLSNRFSHAVEQAVQRWRHDSSEIESLKRKRHTENCEECQSGKQESLVENDGRASVVCETSAGSDSTDVHTPKQKVYDHEKKQVEDTINVVTDAPPSEPHFEATIAIEGMTCASCTTAVTQALDAEPWVHSINVNLLSHSAKVIFDTEANKDKIVETIENIGYDASLQTVNALQPTGNEDTSRSSWQGTYAVSGMTCSSCVASITKQLEEKPWVQKVDVNLLSNNATVTFTGKKHAKQVVEVIEDTGFDAKLDSVVEESQSWSQNNSRVVAMQVNGMYCEHCPDKVLRAVRALESVEMKKALSIDDPVIEISYVPNAPRLNIRSIINAIQQQDDAFEPSVFHPPSIEQRSRDIHRREQLAIFYRLVISIISAIPTFIIGVVYMDLVPDHSSGRKYLMQQLGGVQRANWAMWILATPVYFLAANRFHRRALKEVWILWRPTSRAPLSRRFYRFGSMNMLICLGTSIAYWASFAQMMVAVAHRKRPDSDQKSETYFDSVVFLTMFLLIGRLIEAYSKAKTGDAVNALGHMRPHKALLVDEWQSNENGCIPTFQEVPTDLIDAGDIVRVLPASSPPCDGIVVSGSSQFDESSLTGESKLVDRSINDEVFAGTINKSSAINIRVTGTVGESVLDQVIATIREGQGKRAPMERTADILTSYFVPIITALAIMTWVIWMAFSLSGALPPDYLDVSVGGWAFWSLQFAIAVFVVACPCGLGLAAPTALLVGSGIAAQHGILAKGGGEAFQEASEIDVVAFDKTGTLTVGGEPKIVEAEVENGDEKLIFALVAKLEQDSSHPIARAAVDHCTSNLVLRIETLWTQEVPGKGMRGAFDISQLAHSGPKVMEVIVGNETLLTDNLVTIQTAQQTRLNAWKRAGQSIMLAAARSLPTSSKSEPDKPFHLAATFAASDPLRPEASSVIHSLQAHGISTWMISGDNADTAHAIARHIGISPSNVIAGVLPTEKSAQIKYLQQSQPRRPRRFRHPRPRATVAMIGDGINDAPALATADVGIALASGTDVAVQTAPFVLLNPSSSTQLDLRAVLTLITLSRTVFRRVRFNFAWALVYNIILVPLAAGVLYPAKRGGAHVRLDPAWAALAMACSSVSVVLSSLALRWSWLPGVGFRVEKVSRGSQKSCDDLMAGGEKVDVEKK